jgi:hypothetical protein
MPFIFVCADRPNVNLFQFLQNLDRTFDAVITGSLDDTYSLGREIMKKVKVNAHLQTTDLNPAPPTEDTRLKIETFLESIRAMSFQIVIIVSYESNFNTWLKNTITNEDWGIGAM